MLCVKAQHVHSELTKSIQNTFEIATAYNYSILKAISVIISTGFHVVSMYNFLLVYDDDFIAIHSLPISTTAQCLDAMRLCLAFL